MSGQIEVIYITNAVIYSLPLFVSHRLYHSQRILLEGLTLSPKLFHGLLSLVQKESEGEGLSVLHAHEGKVRAAAFESSTPSTFPQM